MADHGMQSEAGEAAPVMPTVPINHFTRIHKLIN
ncbi:MAG: hypothetical protein A4E66_01807 [Syntrophus sp. PtaB.Bin001]|nr:MAG: hypothetical protein A4E66_01807 [Syntrophus sp. PtaB.Bin001]